MVKAILVNIIFSMFWKKSFILLFEHVRVGQTTSNKLQLCYDPFISMLTIKFQGL